jgi:hypothetical protein
MIRDYYAVKEEYEVIKGKEAREAYVKERKKFVEEIEMVCRFECNKIYRELSYTNIACYSLREMDKKPI